MQTFFTRRKPVDPPSDPPVTDLLLGQSARTWRTTRRRKANTWPNTAFGQRHVTGQPAPTRAPVCARTTGGHYGTRGSRALGTRLTDKAWMFSSVVHVDQYEEAKERVQAGVATERKCQTRAET